VRIGILIALTRRRPVAADDLDQKGEPPHVPQGRPREGRLYL